MINYLLEWIRVCQVFLHRCKLLKPISVHLFPGLSGKSVSYQVKDEYAPNFFKKKKNCLNKVLSGFLEVWVGQAAQVMASHLTPHHPTHTPHARTYTHIFSLEKIGVGVGGSCPGHGILSSTPSSLEKNS